MKNKKLFKVGLVGIGLSLILFSIKNSLESKLLILLAIIVFIYIFINGYKFLKINSETDDKIK